MAKCLVMITFLVVNCILLVVKCRALHHQGFEIREIFPKETESSSPQQPATFLLEIDLGTCLCRNLTTACEVAIDQKSTILEITCAQDELYCCTGRKKQDEFQSIPQNEMVEEGRSFVNPASISTFPDQISEQGVGYEEEEEEGQEEGEVVEQAPAMNKYDDDDTPKINGNYRLVPVLDTLPDLDEDEDNNNGGEELTTEPKKRCRCKPRSECPDRYLDLRYNFFHCSHNTTRCCEPEVEILQEFTNSDQQQHDEDNIDSDEDDSVIMDEEEEDLISDNNEEEEEEPRKICLCLPRSDCSEREGWLRQDDLCPGGLIQCCKSDDSEDFGRPQPIPLPELKIPVTEEIFEMGDEEEERRRHDGSTLLPAPPLPTYYNYQPPAHYSGYYYPPQGRPQQQQWNNHNNGLQNMHIPSHVNPEQSRTINSDSLFDKIAKIIG